MPQRTTPHLHLLLLSLYHLLTSTNPLPIPPPLPIGPLPTSSQLQWQLAEMSLFLHFGTNTFTDREWGTGQADPSLFDPTSLSARQWARTAGANGFGRVLLTAKHHDGFCLWPSAYTNYSVASSPWRGGRGDVVGELAAVAKEAGVGLGLYLSPWDRHEECYGKTEEYNEFYLAQMTELLTRCISQGKFLFWGDCLRLDRTLGFIHEYTGIPAYVECRCGVSDTCTTLCDTD